MVEKTYDKIVNYLETVGSGGHGGDVKFERDVERRNISEVS